MSKFWTKENTERFATLWRAGVPVADISETLGISAAAIGKRRFVLGLDPRQSSDNSPWTDELKQRLRDLHSQGKNDARIAETLGVAQHAVFNQRKKMGLKSVHVKGMPFRQRMAEAREYTPRTEAWSALPETTPKTLLDLEPNDCRWPVGDHPHLFCAAPKNGKSYCAAHEKMAWRREEA